MGGAARFRAEFYNYLAHTDRHDIQVIGDRQRVSPSWLLRREVAGPARAKRIALNNVGFVTPGGERRTLLRNALHFLTDNEVSQLEPSLLTAIGKQTTVVRLAARRSDLLVVPCSAMAERVVTIIPSLRSRVVVRPHPVSADSIPISARDRAILCPVLFESYKRMSERLTELLNAIDMYGDRSLRLRVTADQRDLPAAIASHPKLEFLGKLGSHDLRDIWARSRAIFFPTALESFGYPLAEARVSGYPVIALDTAQNREIAGSALCGFTSGNVKSLQHAIELALSRIVAPDPGPFEPHSYFNWLLGSSL
jgi:glycosyltransferase involved in cell wall biosynthesis